MSKDSKNYEIQQKVPSEDKFSLKTKPAIILCGIIFVLIGIFLIICSFYYQSTNDAFIAANSTDLTPKVSGKIIELKVNNNTEVKKGEIIAQIDPKEYENELKSAQEKLNIAQANLKVSINDINKINSSLKKTKNDIKTASLQLENANSDYILYKNAYKDGSVTKQDLDNAIKNLDVARNELKKAQENTKIANNALQLTMSKKASQSAEIKNLIAQVEEASLNLSYTTLISPVDGIILNKNIESGSYVKKEEPILSITTKDYYVSANFSGKQKTKIKKGQKAVITTGTYNRRTFNAKVDEIIADSSTPVKIIFTDDITNHVVLGMKVSARVKIK